MTTLLTDLHFPDPDAFYEQLIAMHHGLSDAESALVNRFEDVLLERMVEADELSSSLKSEEHELAAAKAETARDPAELDAERASIERNLETAGARRDAPPRR